MLVKLKDKFLASKILQALAGLFAGFLFLYYFSYPVYVLIKWLTRTTTGEIHPAVDLPFCLGSVLSVLQVDFLPSVLAGILCRRLWKTKGWIAGSTLYFLTIIFYLVVYLFIPHNLQIKEYNVSISLSILPFDSQRIWLNLALLAGAVLGGELAEALEGTLLVNFFFSLTLQLICFHFIFLKTLCFNLPLINYLPVVILAMLSETLLPYWGSLSYISMVICYFFGIFFPVHIRYYFNPLQHILNLVIAYGIAGIVGSVVVIGIRFLFRKRQISTP
jgi:hypothetical protein